LIYDEARQLIEGMLVNMPSSPARSSLIAVMSRVYMGQFKLAASRPGGVARAFEIIETARGRSVADSLRFGAHRPGDAPSAAELKIIGVQRRIRSSRTPAEMRRLLFELERVELELAGFESPRNRKSFQDMALLGSKPVPLNFLERQLAPDEAILEYVLDEPSSYCIEIRRTGSSIHSLEGKRTIEAAVDAVVGAIKRKEAFQEKARQLHRLLLSCSSSAATRRLIVVPDGKLHTMPFAALIDSDGRYLIESMTIGYAPSGTVLSVVRGNGKTDGLLKPLFALASSPDVARKSKDVSTTRGFFEEVGSKLGPLPFAKEEVATIGNAAGPGSVLLVDQQASEAELKRQALDRFKIVHIVAHAIVSEKDPERSGLLLQPGSAGEDGLFVGGFEQEGISAPKPCLAGADRRQRGQITGAAAPLGRLDPADGLPVRPRHPLCATRREPLSACLSHGGHPRPWDGWHPRNGPPPPAVPMPQARPLPIARLARSKRVRAAPARQAITKPGRPKADCWANETGARRTCRTRHAGCLRAGRRRWRWIA